MKDLKFSAVICLALIFLVALLAFAQQKAPGASSEQRYLLIPATITAGDPNYRGDDKELFLVDTHTGHVWMYEPTLAIENGNPIPAHFSDIFVNKIDGDFVSHYLKSNRKP